MSATKTYGTLLKQTQPRIIRTEQQNEEYIAQLEKLSARDNLSVDEQDFANLLTVLIEDFEERHYTLESVDPVDIIHQLMEEHGLKQKDLVDVFGTPSVASEVLNGKRPLALTHIKRLAMRFGVPEQVFISTESPHRYMSRRAAAGR